MAQQIRKRSTLREVEEEVWKDSEQLRLERGWEKYFNFQWVWLILYCITQCANMHHELTRDQSVSSL